MNFVLQPWQLFVLLLASWINRQQQAAKPDEVQEQELLGQVAQRVAARPTKDDLFYDASL